MFAFFVSFAGAAMGLGASPAIANPVFQELVERGVTADGSKHIPLPGPMMPDGLDAAAQRKIVEEIARPNFAYDQFTRKSVVAPHVLRMRMVEGADPQMPMQAVDVYFVAYGNLDALTEKDFLRSVFKEDRQQEAAGVALTPERLAERAIAILPEHANQEGYGQTTMPLLNRVELSVVGRSFWSRSDDSLVTAAIVDPRFQDDRQFPNVWRPLVRSATGQLEPGPPQPYRGAGVYLKITPLAQPAGALFVEAHLLYAEPHGWFDGKNLLGAKLPAVVQQKVREMRQEMLRAPK